ncbi:MAG TPA: DUF4383 domain-containing protein [Gemmatimonadaceae bacterium]|jgi:hypothetical protein
MVRRVAMVFGIVFLLLGILGLISPGGMSMGVSSPGMILGLFPVNLLHNIVHLLFGVWGLMASRSFTGAKMYAQVSGVIYIVLAICGWLLPDTFALLPNGGNDIWLHALLGIVLLAVGFTAKDTMATPAPMGAKM